MLLTNCHNTSDRYDAIIPSTVGIGGMIFRIESMRSVRESPSSVSSAKEKYDRDELSSRIEQYFLLSEDDTIGAGDAAVLKGVLITLRVPMGPSKHLVSNNRRGTTAFERTS